MSWASAPLWHSRSDSLKNIPSRTRLTFVILSSVSLTVMFTGSQHCLRMYIKITVCCLKPLPPGSVLESSTGWHGNERATSYKKHVCWADGKCSSEQVNQSNNCGCVFTNTFMQNTPRLLLQTSLNQHFCVVSCIVYARKFQIIDESIKYQLAIRIHCDAKAGFSPRSQT